MSVNINNLSSKELADLITEANKRKKLLAKRKPAGQVKAAVAKFLNNTGWTFEDLYGNLWDLLQYNHDTPYAPAAV